MDKTSDSVQTERSKMLRGEMYLPMDPELVAARVRARRLFARYNASDPADSTGRAALLRELPGDAALMPRSSRLFIVIMVRKSRLPREFL